MARLTQKTEAVLRLAVEEATELEHPVWGSEHVLLALTKGTGEDSGRPAEILNQLGVTEARLRELIDRHGLSRMERAIERRDHVCAGHETAYIVNHARWLAAYLRQPLADPEHLLLGTLWHDKPESKVLRDLQVSFEEAYRQLTGEEAGQEIAPSRSVYVSRRDLEPVVGALQALLPAGVWFGFAQDDELAWFSAHPDVDAEGQEIDLESHIEQALARGR